MEFYLTLIHLGRENSIYYDERFFYNYFTNIVQLIFFRG